MLWFGYSEAFFVGLDGRSTRLLNFNKDFGHVVGELLPIVLGRLQAGLLEPSLDLSRPMGIILVNVWWTNGPLLVSVHSVISIGVYLGNEELENEPPGLVRCEPLLIICDEYFEQLVVAEI